MLRRVSCANAPRAVMASDTFIFPKQWKYILTLTLSQLPWVRKACPWNLLAIGMVFRGEEPV